MYSLGVDVGGTFIKVARLESGVATYPHRVPMPGFLGSPCTEGYPSPSREIDPRKLDVAINLAIRTVGLGEEFDGRVFVSGQMAGLAFIDSDGSAVAPIISWQDQRYTDLEPIIAGLTSTEMLELGDGLRPGSPAATLYWHPRPKGAFVTSLIGYVAGRLAGARATSIHDSDAGSFGLYNTKTGSWSEKACSLSRLGLSELPRVVSEIEPVFIGSQVNVAVADQQASLFGAGLQQGWLSVNLATGCQVSVISDTFSEDSQTRPYFGASAGGPFLKTVTHLPAGRYLASELRKARGFEDWAWLTAVSSDSFGAVADIANSIGQAARKIDAIGLPVLFTGGLVQRVSILREQILEAVGSDYSETFSGDDAALAGLAKLAN